MSASSLTDLSETDAPANEDDQRKLSPRIHTLARGFTISVTAPPDGLAYQLSGSASELCGGQLERGGSRDSDYLEPKGIQEK